jgi:uncharacterized membrane protein
MKNIPWRELASASVKSQNHLRIWAAPRKLSANGCTLLANDCKSANALWILLGVYLVWVLANTSAHLAPAGISSAFEVTLLVSIATLHGLRRYTLKQFLVFFGLAVVVSNFYEDLSINTGFPFGHYHYTGVLGPKLLLVPLLIAPAYFGTGYLAWSLGHVLVGVFGKKLEQVNLFLVPFVASLVMVMWDLVMDPMTSTVQKQWIWQDGGSYFGVPFVNYLGWLLCVYTIFQLFAAYASRPNQGSTPNDVDRTDRTYWY